MESKPRHLPIGFCMTNGYRYVLAFENVTNFPSKFTIILQRNERGYYTIGYRSQLELRSFIETCIRGGHGTEDNAAVDEAERARQDEAIAKLPQIIFY
jgi:hypothetical protein